MPNYSLSPEMTAALRDAGACLSFHPSSIRDPAVGQVLGDIINVLNLQLPRAIDQLINGGAGGGGVAGAQCDEIWLRAIANGGAVPAHLLAGMGNRAASALHAHINEYGGPGVAVPDSAVLARAPAGASLEVLIAAVMDPTRHWFQQTRGYAARPFTCTTPIVYAADVVSHDVVGTTTEYSDTGKALQKLRLTPTGHTDVPVAADWLDVAGAGKEPKKATATADYLDPVAPATYCTVMATPEGEGAPVEVRLYFKVGVEYPNVHEDDILEVFQEADDSWCCMGPHDSPVGALDFNLNHLGSPGTPDARPGWIICEELAGLFPRGYAPGGGGVAVGATDATPTHFHESPGAHAHPYTPTLNVGQDEAYGVSPGITVVTSVEPFPLIQNTGAVDLGATPAAAALPPWYGVAVLKRVNKAGEA